jgi:hypothetical protein
MPPIRVRATRDVPLTTQTTGVQADISGVSPEFAAVGNLGRSIQQGASAIGQIAAAEKRRTQEDELHAASIADSDAYAAFNNELTKNPDWRTYEDDYAGWEKTHRESILNEITDIDARSAASKRLDLLNVQRKTSINEFKRETHKQEIIGNMPEMLAGFSRMPDGIDEEGNVVTGEDIGNKYITGLREGGWISGAQENNFQAQLDASIKNHELLVAEQVVNEEVLQIAIEADAEKEGSGWAATQKWLNDPNTVKELQTELGMSLEDANKVLADVKTRATLANADKVEREEAAQSEESDSVWGKINNAEFAGIEAFIDGQPTLTNKQKLALKEKAEARAKVINADKPDPFEETNSKVYFDTLTNIESMTDAKLQALTGKGLSIADYEKFKGMLAKDSPLNRPSSKRSSAAVERIRAADIKAAIADEDSFDAIDIQVGVEADYLAIQNELDDWKIANSDDPDFDAKLEKKTQQLLTPVIEDVTLGFFEKILSPKAKGKGGIPGLRAVADFFLKNEDQELAQERLQKLKKEPVWATLDDDQRDNVTKAVEKGSSIQDAVEKELGFEDIEIPTVTTQAEYDKLPSGTRYKNSNGDISVKP